MRAAVVLLAMIAPSLSAQVLRWSRAGQENNHILGLPVAPIADRDGDGFQDVAAIVQICQPGGGSCNYYAIWILSGRDGSVLLRMPDLGFANAIAAIAAVDDMDGDRVRDYAITIEYRGGPRYDNAVEVRSGTDDRVLWSVSDSGRAGGFGRWGIAGDLDLDGDGQPNLLVTALGESTSPDHQGVVYAYAPPGVLLYRIASSGPGRYWSIGHSIAKVGDVDGDGGDDFVTTGIDPLVRGVAYLISGRTGNEIRRVFGAQTQDGMLVACAGCDDLDGDGIRDFAAGSGGHRSRGVARVFSSATGRPIYDYTSGRSSFAQGFGSSIRADIDIDQDGIDDILIADPEADLSNPAEGHVYAFSGRDGRPLLRIRSSSGLFLATMPPQGGEPFPRILSTGGTQRPWDTVSLYSAALPGVVAHGVACAGALPAAPRIGIRDLDGRSVRLHLSDAPPGATVGVVLGFAPARVALDALGMPGCALQQSADVIVSMQAGVSGLDAGYARADVPLPLATGPGTFTLYGQWIVLGSGAPGGGTTGALSWRH